MPFRLRNVFILLPVPLGLVIIVCLVLARPLLHYTPVLTPVSQERAREMVSRLNGSWPNDWLRMDLILQHGHEVTMRRALYEREADSNWWMRFHVIHLLLRLRDRPENRIEQMIELAGGLGMDESVRRMSLSWSLEQGCGDSAYVPLLICHLTDRDPVVRAAVTIVLGDLPDHPATLPALLGSPVRDKDPWVRSTAASSLGHVGRIAQDPRYDQELTDTIITFLHDPDENVVEAAMYAATVYSARIPALADALAEFQQE